MQHYQFYNTNIDWIKKNTVYLSLHGSHAYGTNIATSDIDYRGIIIPPKKYFLGFKNNYVLNNLKIYIVLYKKQTGIMELFDGEQSNFLRIT